MLSGKLWRPFADSASILLERSRQVFEFKRRFIGADYFREILGFAEFVFFHVFKLIEPFSR
jgi:hypothetical protein